MNNSSTGRSGIGFTPARSLFALLLLNVLAACSSGESSQNNTDSTTVDADTAVDQPQSEFSETGVQVGELPTDDTPPLPDLSADNGDLLPVLFATQTDLDLSYAEEGIQLIEQINGAFILPADIDVIFADCGVANAFFIPPGNTMDDIDNESALPQSAGGSVVMCHELTQLFSDFYSNKEQAVDASNFVLMHELGHALVDQLALPVLGIEESYVDGMAAVFLGVAGKAQGSALAGWFFGSQSETPFFDTHRAGPQRLGDLACWGVGADPSLTQDPVIDNISQQLMSGGRNCVAEYNQQFDALTVVLGPHIRGELSDIFNNTTP